MIVNLLLKIGLSFAALYLGNKLISARIPIFKLGVIAALGQAFIIYALPYALSVTGMIPISRLDLIFEAIIWIGLANFVVPKTTPKEYLILGVLAFVANYILGYIGIFGLI